MTLSELQQALRDRKIKAINCGFLKGACAVTLFGEDRLAQGAADQLEDAVEIALLRWDGTWR